MVYYSKWLHDVNREGPRARLAPGPRSRCGSSPRARRWGGVEIGLVTVHRSATSSATRAGARSPTTSTARSPERRGQPGRARWIRPSGRQLLRPSTQVWAAVCGGVKSRNHDSLRSVTSHLRIYNATNCRSSWALHFSLVNAAATDDRARSGAGTCGWCRRRTPRRCREPGGSRRPGRRAPSPRRGAASPGSPPRCARSRRRGQSRWPSAASWRPSMWRIRRSLPIGSLGSMLANASVLGDE